ncbi:MAG: hypothetical protein AAGI88_21375 [Pseudomonadota bacterium]
MERRTFWNLAAAVGCTIVALTAVLGIWDLIDGITALKICFTLFLLAGTTAFVEKKINTISA